MIGSIIGDIVGSIYEFDNIKTKDFEFFQKDMAMTDDSLLTLATAKWILNGAEGSPAEEYYDMASDYPHPMGGYGGGFYAWVYRWEIHGFAEPYNSWGNGSAMRVGPVGWAFDTENEVLDAARRSAECTHNHPEGIKGAQATAMCILMARQGKTKEEIRKYIQEKFGYDLSLCVDEIRPIYSWNGLKGANKDGGSCQGTVPQAIICALGADSFEDSIRNAISIGGDSDTLGCITGSIAEALYGITDEIRQKAVEYVPQKLKGVIAEFEKKYN